jgi:hypothetical protein
MPWLVHVRNYPREIICGSIQDMEILKNLEWEALIVDEGWRLHPQKTYHPFSRLNSAFRLLLLSEPPKVYAISYAIPIK